MANFLSRRILPLGVVATLAGKGDQATVIVSDQSEYFAFIGMVQSLQMAVTLVRPGALSRTARI